jgi:hypothetical protein
VRRRSASGQASQERKKGLIAKLMVASKGCEPGYIIRSLQVCAAGRCWRCSAGLRAALLRRRRRARKRRASSRA